MKNTDIAMIILIASVSVMFAFGIVSSIPGLKVSDKPVKVSTATEYTTDVDEPSSEVFGRNAINPTVDVTIGDSSGDSQ